MWPGRIQPRTGTPLATLEVSLFTQDRGRIPRLPGPADEQPDHWLIYRDPIVLSPGQTLRAGHPLLLRDVAALPQQIRGSSSPHRDNMAQHYASHRAVIDLTERKSLGVHPCLLDGAHSINPATGESVVSNPSPDP